MTRDERDPERDDELHRLLERWSAPVVPDGMDERVLQAFRRQAGGARALVVAPVHRERPGAGAGGGGRPDAADRHRRPGPAAGRAAAHRGAGRRSPSRRRGAGTCPWCRATSLAGFQPVTEVTATVVTERSETRQ